MKANDIVWFFSSACNLRRHWVECVGRVNRTFCFTDVIDVSSEKYTQQLARYRLHRPKFEATLSSQAVALLDFCNFLSYRFPSIHHTVKS